MDEQDEEHQQGDLGARPGVTGDRRVRMSDRGPGGDEEGDARRNPREYGGGGALLEAGLEQTDDRGDGHRPRRQPIEGRLPRRGPAAEEEDRDGAEAGGEGSRRRGENQDEHAVSVCG